MWRAALASAAVSAALTALVILLLVPALRGVPTADPHGVPVECAQKGSGHGVGIDTGQCYQLGRHVKFAILGFGSTCDPENSGAGWYQLGGAGEPLTKGSTTFGCVSPSS